MPAQQTQLLPTTRVGKGRKDMEMSVSGGSVRL